MFLLFFSLGGKVSELYFTLSVYTRRLPHKDNGAAILEKNMYFFFFFFGLVNRRDVSVFSIQAQVKPDYVSC